MKTKHGAEFADVRKFISDGQSFTLLTHISPDGDTLGSALALKLLLNALGKTAEVVQDLAGLKAIGCKTVAFTSDPDSPLAQGCAYRLIYPALAEADHLNLAPTVSSTLTLVLGDALACALSEEKGFTREDFHRSHPKGALGERLLREKDNG